MYRYAMRETNKNRENWKYIFIRYIVFYLIGFLQHVQTFRPSYSSIHIFCHVLNGFNKIIAYESA